MKRIKKLLPKSLFGRITLTLVSIVAVSQATVIILSQTIPLRIFSPEVIDARAQLSAAIAETFSSLSPEERELFLQGIRNPLVRVLAYDEPQFYWPEPGISEDETRLQKRVRESVEQYLTGETTKQNFRAAIADDVNMQEIISWAIDKNIETYNIPSELIEKIGKLPERPPLKYRHVLYVIPISDGTWLEFSHYASLGYQQIRDVILAMTISMTALLLLASILISRWLVTPLRRLSDGAEALGRDINAPELPMQGSLEVRRTTKAFNEMKQQLMHFLQERTRMLIAISHDLKTPLTRLQLYVDQVEPSNEKEIELRDKFSKELDGLKKMTLATLELLRGQEDTEKTQPLDIMSLLETIQESFKDAGYSFTIEGATSKAVPGKFISLKRCLSNLIENALYYGTDVRVMIKDSSKQLTILISNELKHETNSEELAQFFKPFYRAENSVQEHPESTGLGLSIAYNIMQAHRGDLTLHLSDHRIITTLTLPR